MTGTGMIMAAGGPYGTGGGGGPPALRITMSNTGGSPVNVSGADGTANIFTYSVTGGDGNYTVSAGAANIGPNPSGKLSQGNPSAPHSPTGSFSMTWSGFVVNEIEAAYFGCSVVDGTGAFDSTSTGSLSVKRTS